MPARVHLVSINPELDDDNQLALKMLVAGDSRDRAIELAARRMEELQRFAQTHITREHSSQSTTGDTEQDGTGGDLHLGEIGPAAKKVEPNLPMTKKG